MAKKTGTHRVVLDASPQAVGVTPGMPLSEAMTECAIAALVDPDPMAYRAAFEEVLTAVEALGVDVDEEGLGLAYVETSGLERLFGGEERLCDLLLRAVPPSFEPRLGVAGSKFAAYVAAGMALPGGLHRFGDDAAALAPLGVDVLPVPWKTKIRLRGFGLVTLGDVASLPLGALQAQFGRAGKWMAEMAAGIDSRPIVPRRREEALQDSLSFPSPTVALAAITMAVETLLGRIFAQRTMRGRYARVCTLDGAVFRAPRWHRRIVFHEPLSDPRRAAILTQHTLQGHPPPGPLEDLRVTLTSITGEGGRQESLLADARRSENLKEALQQLGARLGTWAPIYQVREVEPWSRMPERRRVLVPYVP